MFMAILIVGADRITKIHEEICMDQNQEIIHWKGRSKINSKKYIIPSDVDKIIVFYDFINHNLMYLIKKQAKRHNVPVVYSKRAMTSLMEKLS